MISCTTPSIRPEMLPIVANCLANQDFKDFEWLIGAPERLREPIKGVLKGFSYVFVPEPQKREGDFYNLNKCWNELFRQAKGDLIVDIVDGIWFPNDTLTSFWSHYENNPNACISGIGHQYEDNGIRKPEVLVWRDPRLQTQYGSFWEINPIDLELCLTSLPRQGVLNVKGIKEIFDKGAAISEKEMCVRMDKSGYRFFIDSSIEYRAIQHPRIGGTEKWDKHYKIACDLLDQMWPKINNGEDLEGNL